MIYMTHINIYSKKSIIDLLFILSYALLSAQYSIQKIQYETDSCDGKIRYVDVLDAEATLNIFYEFKSVNRVPPGKFKEQFLKNLTNSNSLDQIKWIFDASKNPAGISKNFRDAMEDAIKGLTIPNNILLQYNLTSIELKNSIISMFDKIFSVK